MRWTALFLAGVILWSCSDPLVHRKEVLTYDTSTRDRIDTLVERINVLRDRTDSLAARVGDLEDENVRLKAALAQR